LSNEIYTDIEIAEAEKLLKSTDILEKLVRMTEKMAFTGEVKNKKLIYLCATSRISIYAFSLIVKGPSSSGKSELTDLILKFIPKEAIIDTGIISEKALFNLKEGLSHKILYVYEYEGSKAADYPMRISISEGKLSSIVTEKNSETGKLEANYNEVDCTGLVTIQTTTAKNIHNENETRLFTLKMDVSEAQTEKILEIQAKEAEGKLPNKVYIKSELRVWRCAQTLLVPYEVNVPFASKLSKIFPVKTVRARRDFPRVLSLIRCHVLLYQKQRRVVGGKIIADYRDLKGVLELISIAVENIIPELSIKQIRVLERFKELQKKHVGKSYSLQELLKEVKDIVGESTLKKYLTNFKENELVKWNGRQGAGSTYELDPLANSDIKQSNFHRSLINLTEDLAKTEIAHLVCLANKLKRFIKNKQKAIKPPIAKLALANPNSKNCNNNGTLQAYP